MTGNVAAYRKSLENRTTTHNDHTLVTASSGNMSSNNEKPSQRKSFDTKLSSDFRKSLESLDEKKTTPPPVLSKKPIVPIKKSPTVSSVAGNIFSGLKQIVKSDKQSSNDSLDGIGSSKSSSASQIADITEKGVFIERIKKDDLDFDNVERSSILQDMRVGRVKAPKRRLPTSSTSFGNSIDNNNSTTYQNGGNGFTEPLFDGKPPIAGLPPPSSSSATSATSDDDSAKPKSRNWEKQKAPWMDELKASQAKKTSPSINDTKSPEIPILQKSHTVEHHNQHQHHHHNQQHQHHEALEKFDMSKSFSSSYVSSSSSSLLTSSSSHNKKSVDSSAIESLRSSSVDVKPVTSSIDMTTTTQYSKKNEIGEPQNIMAKSMSVIATKSNDTTAALSATASVSIDDTINNVKVRPSSVNLKNRSVSPVARIINAPSSSSTSSSSQPLDIVSLRVIELEQKVAKLEAIVTVQSKTIEELVRSVKEESETVKQLRSELDKYAQCVTQV